MADNAGHSEAPATKGSERDDDKRVEAGFQLIISAVPSRIYRALIEPSEASNANIPGRWDMPLQEGAYTLGSLKRSFSTVLGLTWVSDRELVKVEEGSILVWRIIKPLFATEEVWSLKPDDKRVRSRVSLVYKPRKLGFFSRIFWKMLVARRRSSEARRRLKALKGYLESLS